MKCFFQLITSKLKVILTTHFFYKTKNHTSIELLILHLKMSSLIALDKVMEELKIPKEITQIIFDYQDYTTGRNLAIGCKSVIYQRRPLQMFRNMREHNILRIGSVIEDNDSIFLSMTMISKIYVNDIFKVIVNKVPRIELSEPALRIYNLICHRIHQGGITEDDIFIDFGSRPRF